MPPLIIHKGKYHDSWSQGCMLGAMVRGSKKGYINKKLFADYDKKLIYHLHANGNLGRGKRHMILMDSHYSHVFNYCFMNMMYQQNIKVLTLNPHTSYWAQPLDNSSTVPLSNSSTNRCKASQDSQVGDHCKRASICHCLMWHGSRQ